MAYQPRGLLRMSFFVRSAVVLPLSVLVVYPSSAHAMHISEGILPFSWALLWYLVSLPFLALGIRTITRHSRNDLSFKPLVGLISALVFVISCMPVPVPVVGTCSHPCGTGLAAVLLGPVVSVVVASVALLIQALFLAHGGLSTWGANLFSMGVVGSFCGFAIFWLVRRLGFGLIPAGFMAGLVGDWSTYAATAGILGAGIRGDSPFMPLFGKIGLAFLPTQLPLGIIEGVLTAGMLAVLARRRPDLLVQVGVLKQEEVGR